MDISSLNPLHTSVWILLIQDLYRTRNNQDPRCPHYQHISYVTPKAWALCSDLTCSSYWQDCGLWKDVMGRGLVASSAEQQLLVCWDLMNCPNEMKPPALRKLHLQPMGQLENTHNTHTVVHIFSESTCYKIQFPQMCFWRRLSTVEEHHLHPGLPTRLHWALCGTMYHRVSV